MYLITYQKRNSYRGHFHEALFKTHKQAKDFLLSEGFIEDNRVFYNEPSSLKSSRVAYINYMKVK